VPQTIVVQHVNGYVLGIVPQTGFLRILLLGSSHRPLRGCLVSFLPRVKRFLFDTVGLVPRIRGQHSQVPVVQSYLLPTPILQGSTNNRTDVHYRIRGCTYPGRIYHINTHPVMCRWSLRHCIRNCRKRDECVIIFPLIPAQIATVDVAISEKALAQIFEGCLQ